MSRNSVVKKCVEITVGKQCVANSVVNTVFNTVFQPTNPPSNARKTVR